MNTVVILAAIAVAGLYLRWATRPVLAAYQVGRLVERMLTTRYGGAARPDHGLRKER